MEEKRKEVIVIDEREVLGKRFRIYGTIENPLFLAKDVAAWIDYSKTGEGYYDVSSMIQTIDAEEKTLREIFVVTKLQRKWFLTEEGLYEVLMQSHLPIAKSFKKEVKKILKEIRLTGSYNAPQFNLPKDFPSALRMLADSEEAKALIIQERDAANLKIEQDKPKIDSFNKFLDTDETYSMTNAFKLIGEKPNIGMAVLRKYKIIYQRQGQNIPSQIYIDKGIFVLKAVTTSTNKKSYPQTRVTPEGITWLRSKYPVLLQNEISLARH